jgi:hypothetical protein
MKYLRENPFLDCDFYMHCRGTYLVSYKEIQRPPTSQLDLERKIFPAHLPLACTINLTMHLTCPATWASEPIQGWKGVLCPHLQHTETFA